MATISESFTFSLLSQAAYAEFGAFDRDSVIAALQAEDFTLKQAQEFTDPTIGFKSKGSVSIDMNISRLLDNNIIETGVLTC